MNAALKLLREYRLKMEFADLGDWGVDELRSEYDPKGPVIRINIRVAEQLSPREFGEFVAFCVGHELYHHREAIGEVPRVLGHRERETAANDFARKLLDSR